MKIEYEATFPEINKDEIREKLKQAGAKLVKPEFEQRRAVFHLPENARGDGQTWLRVRDEGDRVTMSLKRIAGDKIESQKEVCLTVNSYEDAISFLTSIGCKQKSYQETKRELWKIGEVEITIDQWPFLEPFVEVEGASEAEVKNACAQVGLDYSQALFCAVDALYEKKYGVSKDVINNQTPLIIFSGNNPFKP